MTIDLVSKNHWTLLVIMSKKEQTSREKYVFYCSVSQIHINPEKNTKKHQNECLECTYTRRQIKNDQPGSHDFQLILNPFP